MSHSTRCSAHVAAIAAILAMLTACNPPPSEPQATLQPANGICPADSYPVSQDPYDPSYCIPNPPPGITWDTPVWGSEVSPPTIPGYTDANGVHHVF